MSALYDNEKPPNDATNYVYQFAALRRSMSTEHITSLAKEGKAKPTVANPTTPEALGGRVGNRHAPDCGHQRADSIAYASS
jgi:hypothetical protein